MGPHTRVGARTIVRAVMAICLTATACSRDDHRAKREQRMVVVGDTQRTEAARRDTLEFESGGDVGTAWPDRPATARWITDANILALFGAMNARQIAAADIELENWHNDAARAFAASIAREHAELQRSADSIALRLSITPVAPALTKPWMAVMQAQIDTMRRTRESSLDRAFAHQQVTSHQLMLDYIQQLAGASQNPELQTMLTAAAKRVISQIERARALEASLPARTTEK